MKINFTPIAILCLVSLAVSWPANFSPAADGAAGKKYVVGGPLAGEAIPLYETQHGEPPGYPGCLKNEDGTFLYSPQGQAPERQLYPGSVEHYRGYMFKYMPIRSMFDQQSLIKNFPAKDIPGVKPAQVEAYAEPVYHVGRGNSAVQVRLGNKPLFNKPVPVVRCKAADPVFKLDFGRLPVGLYAIRIIGAVESAKIQRHRKPLVLRVTVNDGINNEQSVYRQRLGYVDEFYSIAEIYFHAPVQRPYQAEVTLEAGTEVDLLVHNITLDDALAGTEFRAFKTKPNLFTTGERALLRNQNKPWAGKPLDKESRWTSDATLWNAMVPLNAQPGFIWGMGGDDPKSNWPRFGVAGKEPEAIEQEFGKWIDVPGMDPVLMKNAKLKLQYTVADLSAGRPLPDPYPFKDNGLGIFTPPEKGQATPQNWIPVAQAVRTRLRTAENAVGAAVKAYHETGNLEAARDAAILLARYAYDFPAMDSGRAMSSIMVQPGAYGRDLRCRQREQMACWMSFYANDIHLVEHYDKLFDFIQNNEDLAQSVGRFIPWVKTPQNLVALFDTYLVQNEVKHVMRHHYYTYPDKSMCAATVLGDTSLTDPWMEWQFSSTWSYPLPPCGLQDIMVSNMDRNGVQNIGSFFYAQGENAANYAGTKNEKYMLAGGNPKYDLRDAKRYPKITQSTFFWLRGMIAGLWHMPIGDVTGPDKGRGHFFESYSESCRQGWRWTKSPAFAYMLKNYYGRSTETDADWAELEKAAATLRRPPFMENKSRFVANWAGILESGLQQDDFRFRRAVMLRLGVGSGHSHADTFDLQYFAHGCAMTADGGQRGGYSTPGDDISRVHNTIEIDGRNLRIHAWMTALSDAEGARYMAGQALSPAQEVSLVRRQVALVDVDEGRPSGKPLSPADFKPNAILDPDVVTPNAYVFDVARVAGGKMHTYCFHGYVADAVESNIEGSRAGDKEDYLKAFPLPEKKFAGTAPETVQATWQISRRYEKNSMLRGSFQENGPQKFTRLHVLGHKGDALLQADHRCNQLKYDLTHLYVQRKSDHEIESVFPAIIEGYAGAPFIQSVRLVDVAANETDATRAVAVEVKTANNRVDLCFADGKPDKTRTIGAIQVAGEFALYATDTNGFRQATLTGGTLLRGADVVLQPSARERTANVVKVDYGKKTIWLDQAWKTPSLKDRVMQIGTPAANDQPGHWTAYTIDGSQAEANGLQLVLQGGADYYLSRVQEVDPEKNIVWCGLPKAGCSGLNTGWVASNDDVSKTWRVAPGSSQRGDSSYAFRVTSGGPVKMEDFGESRIFRLWEYGAGDQVRQNTFASIRRLGAGLYELTADTDLTVALKGVSIELSADQSNWRKLSTRQANGLAECALTVPDLGPAGRVYLRTP